MRYNVHVLTMMAISLLQRVSQVKVGGIGGRLVGIGGIGWFRSLGGVRCRLFRVSSRWVCSRWERSSCCLENLLHFKSQTRVGRRGFLALCTVGSRLRRTSSRQGWRLGRIEGYSSSGVRCSWAGLDVSCGGNNCGCGIGSCRSACGSGTG